MLLGASGFAAQTLQAAAAPPAPQASAKASAPVAAETDALDRLFRDAVKPGDPAVTAIVVKNGQALLRAGYGLANVELNVPATPEHVFRIGSVTKQFTAALVLMLAEEGKLALADPVTKYLPDYPVGGKTITIEHLLTHTSGIQSYTDIPRWRGMLREDLSLTALIDAFKNEPMVFEPGERWRYNNSGYVLLGAVIEKVGGKSYADAVRERICVPLGMADTRYDVTDEVVARRAAGYGRVKDRLVNAQYLSMTQPYAAGALLSTVDDLAKWDAGLGSGKLLKPESLAKMFTSFTLTGGGRTGYGYGWQVGTFEGRPSQEHGGGIPGFRAHVVRLPEDRVYVAVLSNLGAPQPDTQLLARKAAAIAAGKPLTNPAPATLTAEQLEEYVGRFAPPSGPRHIVTRDGTRMFVQISSGGRTEIVPAGQDLFFVRDSFLRLRFERDAGGKVARLVIDDWGAQPVATRDETPEPARVAIAVDPAIYDAYVGEYELAPGFMLTVTREGSQLMTQATGQAKVEVFPSSPTDFFLKIVDAQISFKKDASGAVTHLVLFQGGREVPAKKIK